MELYKNLYFTLFGKVEDALVLMDDGNMPEAKQTLLDALEQAEETYMNAAEDPSEEAALLELTARLCEAIHRLEPEERREIFGLAEQLIE